MRPFRTKVIPLQCCKVSTPQVDAFQSRYFRHQKPVKYERKVFARLNKIPAVDTWIKPFSQSQNHPFFGPYELNHEHLARHGDTIVPIERTTWADEGKTWDVRSFERFEAPLSFFLEWTKHKLADPQNFSPNEGLYIAQCSIQDLPTELRRELPAPVYCTRKDDEVKKATRKAIKQGKDPRPTETESSSIWMGIPPTETPLHKDPNHNFLFQLAGFKTVRMMEPDDGEFMLAYAKREVAAQLHAQGQAGRLDMSMRGEEMMVGPERSLMSELVWAQPGVASKISRHFATIESGTEASTVVSGQDAVEDTVEDQKQDAMHVHEVTLAPGDAVFIPKGWYHAVRSLGSASTGINVSANWWFRIGKVEKQHAKRDAAKARRELLPLHLRTRLPTNDRHKRPHERMGHQLVGRI